MLTRPESSSSIEPVSRHETDYDAASSSSFDRLSLSSIDSDEIYGSQYPQDSIAKRRRHAEYSHRPPVLKSLPPQNSFHQKQARLCTRLQSARDTRLDEDEKWAIQEGSLVVCIDPSYTLLQREERLPDEFKLVNGDFYIVCQLYSDLWALCFKVSLAPLSGNRGYQDGDSEVPIFAFLPLCAVTLAANLSAFINRCTVFKCPPNAPSHPGNGLPVTPPPRSHSLAASQQLFPSSGLQVDLPEAILDTQYSISVEETDMEVVPLDSTLEQMFTGFGGRMERIRELRKRMTAWKVFNNAKQSLRVDRGSTGTEDDERGLARTFSRRGRGFGFRRSEEGRRRRQSRKERGSSSSTGESLKWLFGISTRDQMTEKRNIRYSVGRTSSGSSSMGY